MAIKTEELVKKVEASPEGRSRIARLQEAVDTFAKRQTQKSLEVVSKSKDNTIRFVALGDTQIGSLYERLDVMKAAYDLADRENIDIVFHTGDVVDGHNIYRGQEFELHKHGWDQQLEWLKDHIPVSKAMTYFITGNHDASFKKQAGIEPGKAFESNLKNWVFLGADVGNITIKDGKGSSFKVALLHPGGGSAYALSYRAQKIVEQWEGGTKPGLLLIGHYHKAEFIPSYRNIAILQTGCCQNQTPFMVRGGLAAHVGFWIVEVNVGKTHNRIRAEFVAVYK